MSILQGPARQGSPSREVPPENPARGRKYMVVSGTPAPLDDELAEGG